MVLAAMRVMRSQLTLSCETGHAPIVMLDLVSARPTPPPLAGVYAAVRDQWRPATRGDVMGTKPLDIAEW